MEMNALWPAFWAFLLVYGVVMWWVSPRATNPRTFFSGADDSGRPVTGWWLTASVFISWIFAKSVTNAANLGAAYGAVGGLAYATYWLSIPLAGLVIYRLRTRHGASGMVAFLVSKYGRLAALGFAVAILIRLYNEVWSNTAVVGNYFGAPGETGYYAAALTFTFLTLAYSIKGGLRGSIITDAIQALVFVFFLGMVLMTIVPQHGVQRLAGSGTFNLGSGVDLLLVALLQVFSYPFHDPVLTDRGFLSNEKTMLRSFIVAGLLGFIAILVFSTVGVSAYLQGMEVAGNAPAAVGHSLGLATFFFMSVIMMTSAGSTLDSTFAALSKNIAQDLPLVGGRGGVLPRMRTGIFVMAAFAIVGNLPMFLGTEILKATTVSGTMVMGLAPVFLLHGMSRYSPASFHLSFWPGVALGVLLAAGKVPDAWAIGDGKYALLLGTNLYGLALCTAGYLAPLTLQAVLPRRHALETNRP